MKMEITRNSIRIIPEDEQDIAFIEDTLGLVKEDDFINLKRISPLGLDVIAYLEAKKEKN